MSLFSTNLGLDPAPTQNDFPEAKHFIDTAAELNNS
jgi:hypothetical protein